MEKLLVIMRHGKAEPRETNVPDERRSLTDTGRRALAAQLPRMLSPLEPVSAARIEIWASPAARTLQTAHEVAHYLGIDEVKPNAHLLTQNADAFFADLVASDAECIVAVGHNPFVEATVLSLCGAAIPFSTGALAALSLEYDANPSDTASEALPNAPETDPDASDSPSPVLESAQRAPSGLSARLLWFAQGPQAKNWKTLCGIEDVVARMMGKVEARFAEFMRAPDDPEALHDLRVSIRTLRSLVAFIEPYQSKAQNRSLQANLRDVVIETSRLREYDVLLEQIDALDTPSFELASLCKEKRAAERDRVIKELWGKRLTRALAHAHDAAYHIEWKSKVEERGLPAATLQQRYDALLAEFKAKEQATDLRDIEAAHSLRKNAKRLRYIAEAFREMLGSERAVHATQMVRMQDSLGALCDAYAAKEILKVLRKASLAGQALASLDAIEALADETIDQIAPISYENAQEMPQ